MRSSAPSWSSASRSSKPPTCSPLMKICGTVRRPLRSIISALLPGSVSIAISSISTPFSCSRLRALTQNGQVAVEYISIFMVIHLLGKKRWRLYAPVGFGQPAILARQPHRAVGEQPVQRSAAARLRPVFSKLGNHHPHQRRVTVAAVIIAHEFYQPPVILAQLPPDRKSVGS